MSSAFRRTTRRLGVTLAAILLATACSSTARTTPQIDLPEPAIPMFMTDGIAGWEDAEIRSLCVEMEAEGDLQDSLDGTPAEYLAKVIAGFGVPIVPEACDATLRVELSARRILASYGCYQGFAGTAVATLSMPDRRPTTGSYDDRYEPPGMIPEDMCVEEPTVGHDMWQLMLVGEEDEDGPAGVIVDLFGEPVWLGLSTVYARHATGKSVNYLQRPEGDLINDDAIALIIARLSGEDPDGRRMAAYLAGDLARKVDDDAREGLDPVIPYLILALALEDQREIETLGQMDDGRIDEDCPPERRAIGGALQDITGAKMDARADLWWEWWQKR